MELRELFEKHYDDCNFEDHDDKCDWAREGAFEELDEADITTPEIEMELVAIYWEFKQK